MILKLWIALILIVLGIVLIVLKREAIKKKLEERYQRTSVKVSGITWSEKNGTQHTEDIVLKRSRLWLIGDWGRIYPLINEDGSWNWINAVFGGKKNFIKVLLILVVIGLFLYGFYEVFHSFEIYRQSCIAVEGFVK